MRRLLLLSLPVKQFVRSGGENTFVGGGEALLRYYCDPHTALVCEKYILEGTTARVPVYR